MLLSEEFVYLHAPKTGGTFVTEALADVYARHLKRPLVNQDKHGGVARIPAAHRCKQLVTSIRNPFDWYASQYQFGYWISREWDDTFFWDEERMSRHFASYPYLSFEEFLDGAFRVGNKYLDYEKQYLAERLHLGPATVSALAYSVPDHVGLLEQLLVDGTTKELKRQIAQTRFLHTESLNRDTYCWLLDLNVSREIAEATIFKSAVKPLNTPGDRILDDGHGQPRVTPWTTFFSERSKAAVFEYEWLFFQLFPEYSWASQAIMQTPCRRAISRIDSIGCWDQLDRPGNPMREVLAK